jgi:hypothetical protein
VQLLQLEAEEQVVLTITLSALTVALLYHTLPDQQ